MVLLRRLLEKRKVRSPLTLLAYLFLAFSLTGCPKLKVGGTVGGLAGKLVIEETFSGEELDIFQNGEFTLEKNFSNGEPYNIVISIDPVGQQCEVTDGSGTYVGEPITDVVITCEYDSVLVFQDPNPDNIFPDPSDPVTGEDNGWQVATPDQIQAMGLDFDKLEQAAIRLKEVDRTRYSVIFVKHGKIVYERYWTGDKDTPNLAFSAAKSFASTLAGAAIQQGLLELHTKVHDLIPNAPINIKPGAEIIHLMSQTSENEPLGTGFSYDNDPAMNRIPEMIGVAVREEMQITLWDFAVEYVLDVIGIPFEYGVSNGRYWGRGIAKWYNDGYDDGIVHFEPEDGMLDCGSIAMKLTTRDLARLGWLWLNKGNWDGTQVFSEKFYSQASNPPFPGANSIYAFNFWTNRPGNWQMPPSTHIGTGKFTPRKPDDVFYVAGTAGQYSFIIPTHNMVVASMGANYLGTLMLRKTITRLWEAIEVGIGEAINPVRPIWTDYSE